MRRLRPTTLTLVALAGAACTSATGPGVDGTGQGRLQENARRLQIAVVPLDGPAARGSEIALAATLHNPTSATVDVGQLCGPPVVFEVIAPSGARLYPVPLDGAFTCQRLDVHDVEPGETDEVRVTWRVPAEAGTYRVRAGLRLRGGFEPVTPARELEVR